MSTLRWSGILLAAVALAATQVSPVLASGGKKAASPAKRADGLVIEDLVVGKGKEARPGMRVSVHYTGRLTNGAKFDSSLDRRQPFDFILGMGEVIKGWDEGVKGMKVGGKRKLTIPHTMAYGESGTGPIPPRATLLFDVELLDVRQP